MEISNGFETYAREAGVALSIDVTLDDLFFKNIESG